MNSKLSFCKVALVLLALLACGALACASNPNRTGKLVGVQTSFSLDDAINGSMNSLGSSGIVYVELDDGTEVEAKWDKSLGSTLKGGMRLELAPTDDPDLWKVVKVLN